jgi:hypothetical protein
MSEKRFDIVVWNYDRLELFFRNFTKIRNYDPTRDRITVVSSSRSTAEMGKVKEFESSHGVAVRYLPRANRGIDQLARVEYFTGALGDFEENLSHAYIFQMQDHYLDTESDASRAGAEYGFKIKEDVVPNDIVFDLERMEQLGAEYDLKGFFCDRDSSLFSLATGTYIAPNGGNFVIRTDAIRDESVQRACRQLAWSCDNRWDWAVYAELMWGVIFFQEGERFYDLKREKLFETWSDETFSRSYEPVFHRLTRYYEGSSRATTLARKGMWWMRHPPERLRRMLRAGLPAPAYRSLRALRDALVSRSRNPLAPR